MSNIYLEKANENECCSICGSQDNVREIDFKEGKGILFIVLCNIHWNELKNILNIEKVNRGGEEK